MRRILLSMVVGTFALACGPTEAKRIAQACETAYIAENWDSATPICAKAQKLNPQDQLIASYARSAWLKRAKRLISEAAERKQRELDAQAAVAAAQDLADAQDREARAAEQLNYILSATPTPR